MLSKLIGRILIWGLAIIAGIGIGCALSYYFTGTYRSFWTPMPVVVCGGCYLIHILNKLTDGDGDVGSLFGGKKKNKGKLTSKNKEGKEISQFFDSRWITEKELKNEKKFMYCTWHSIRDAKDGVLLRSELKGSNLDINMYSPIHAMIIGTTGTGKTQKYIEPSIQILSSTKTKPSFVLADPKGELYEKHCHKLKQEGYDVKVFNLRQPYASTRWNPMDNAYMLYHKAFHLYEHVQTHVGVNPADLDLKIIAREYENQWYEFEGVAYPNKQTLDSDLSSKKAELIDLAENELREIAGVLCPI